MLERKPEVTVKGIQAKMEMYWSFSMDATFMKKHVASRMEGSGNDVTAIEKF